MQKNFDQEIEEKQKEFEQIKSDMDSHKEKFIQETVVLVKKLYKEISENEAKTNAKNTLALRKDGIINFKQKVASLVENADEKVKKHLDVKELWLHLAENPDGSHIFHSPQEAIKDSVKCAVGELAQLLEDFGYLEKNNYGYRPWHGDYGSPAKYPKDISWTSGMFTAFENYRNLFDRFNHTKREIERLNGEKNKEAAKKIWDESQ